MTSGYRFLPWARAGLAAELTGPDPLDGTLAARARLPVEVRVNTGARVGVDVALHGPGDVIGVDGRGIVRRDPAPRATDVEPNYLATIEFDRPDFPWMFTPAAAGAGGRLRPWCVLVVVERRPDVGPRTDRSRPLPTITVPVAELPPLDQSWAWAHTQVVTEQDTTAAILATLRDAPDLHVSRLLCPRRLQPDTEWLACLVPAFAAGVAAGLGAPVDDDAPLAPAWQDGQPVVQLPVYDHWAFATGPGGDFESLARRLAAPVEPLSLGATPMGVAHADEGLPPLPATTAVVDLEGALVGPEHDVAVPRAAMPADWVAALSTLLDAPARLLADGDGTAPPVTPPIYGAWPAATHTVPSDVPVWLREANLHPAARAVSGLGAEVVRAHQEALVHDAWLQVGDVLAANALIDRGRLAREVAAKLHDRIATGMGRDRIVVLTAPAHHRLRAGTASVQAQLHASRVPDAVVSPGFRRLTGRRGVVARRAARRVVAGDGRAAAPPAGVVDRLDTGSLPGRPAGVTPDAVGESRALRAIGRVPASGSVDLGAIGGRRPVDSAILRELQAKGGTGRVPATDGVVLRGDLDTTGVVLKDPFAFGGLPGKGVADRVAARAAVAAGLREDADDALARAAAAGELMPHARPVPPPGDGPGGPRRPGPPVDPPPRDVPPPGDMPARDVPPPRDRPPVGTGPPPPRSNAPAVIGRIRAAWTAHVRSLRPAPPDHPGAPLGVTRVGDAVLADTDPRVVVPARAAAMVQLPTTGGAGSGRAAVPIVTPAPGLGGLRVGPVLRRPMYEVLAEHAPERLLPGIGTIPTNTVALLQTNPRFVASFLLGANTELSGELVWREYPAPRDTTPLRRFWDRAGGRDDLPDLRSADATAGLATLVDPGGGGTGDVVLVVRGDLFLRYPDTIVTLVRATGDGGLSDRPEDHHQPVLRGRIDPDVTFVGFDRSLAEVVGDPGFHIVLQQQPTAPRFGFDVPTPGDPATPATWRDATWGHVGVDPGDHLTVDPTAVVVPQDPGGTTWVADAAHLAAITMQQPVRVAIHARALIATQVG